MNLLHAPPQIGHATSQQTSRFFEALGAAALSCLTGAAIAAMLAISSMMLGSWGFSYEATGGTPLEKLHPATWMIFAAFLLAMAGAGNPLRYLDDLVARHPGIFVFSLCFALALGHVIFILKVGFTPLVDTFLMPMLLAVLISRMGETGKRRTALIIHVIFAANAALGIYEYLSGYRLTPYVAGTLLIEGDWRSTALFGHPLANASLTASYLVALCVGGGREMPAFVRFAMVGLLLAAMVAFGGRSSLVILLAFLAVAVLRHMSGWLAGNSISLPGAALAMLLVPLVAASIASLLQAGFLDRLADRFADDNGSANARVLMLRLFDLLTWPELLFGPDPAKLNTLQQQEGIYYGLESLWLAFILGYGLIVSLIFFTGLLFFCLELIGRSRPGSWQVMAFYFIVASTSVSLSAKTHTFGVIIAIMLVVLRHSAAAQGRNDQS